MKGIDQAPFHFDPKFGIVSGVLVAVMVFGVALDLRWDNFRRLLRSPRALVVGLLAQIVILPGIAFLIARGLVHTPSAALGLILVSCCPGGAFSNFLSGLAQGDVATSVSLTAVNTATCVLTTPVFFGFWASLLPSTAGLLREVGLDAGKLAVVFGITIGLPVAAGMLLHARRPSVSARIRPWVRRFSLLLLAFVIVMGTTTNGRLLVGFAREALLPTVLCCVCAHTLGWGLSWLARLRVVDRRAVTIEAGGQNVTIEIGLAVAFFPSLAGVAVMGAVWGVVQIFVVVPLALVWSRMAPGES